MVPCRRYGSQAVIDIVGGTCYTAMSQPDSNVSKWKSDDYCRMLPFLADDTTIRVDNSVPDDFTLAGDDCHGLGWPLECKLLSERHLRFRGVVV